ncbi:hypothetical protein M758_5G069300 [Ceratodon purpureus]|nr:hypothetical protein M758_5G069300 [Ceratodon purpureus]
MGAAGEEGEAQAQGGSRAKLVLHIPSHAQVLENSGPQPPLSFFRPSSGAAQPSQAAGGASEVSVQQGRAGGAPVSFTEAFSFVRQTDFYTAPPPAAAPAAGVPASSSGGDRGGSFGSQPPAALPTVTSQSRNAILVSRRQTGNPLLKFIRNVWWVYADIVPDYQLGQTTCALYISLRYHLLHPDYLYFRIRELQKGFPLRVVLCHVDLEDVIKPLHEVIKIALLHDCSLLCGWSLEECARYLETLKTYENKPADNIQERTDNDYLSRLTSALTSVRHVNKTDVLTLGSSFGTLAGVVGASMEDLSRCPGIGEKKVKRLYDSFHEPFQRTTKQLRLDNLVVKHRKNANIESSTPVDSPTIPLDATDPADSSTETNVDKPEPSVREALEAARVAKRKASIRTETSMKDMSTDNRQTPPVNIEVEVIDLT